MILGEALSVLHRIDRAEAEIVPSHQKIIGMRNVLVHGYSIVDAEVVWAAANINVPALIGVLSARVE